MELISKMCLKLSQLYIVTMYTFALRPQNTALANRKLVFIHEAKSWEEAHKTCILYSNGKLASLDIIKNHRPECANSTYWTGNIEVVTPFISLQGCFDFSTPTSGGASSTAKANSVEQCAIICGEKDFLMRVRSRTRSIKEDLCTCLPDNGSSVNLRKINASLCSSKCREGTQYCGGKGAANKYRIHKGNRKSEVFEECLFASCGESKLTADNCTGSGLDHTFLVCNTTNDDLVGFQKGNVTSWLNATEKCIQQYGGYPVEGFTKDSDACSIQNVNEGTWTSTKSYGGEVLSEEKSLAGYKINRCTYTDGVSSEDSKNCQKDPDQLHFACIMDASAAHSYSCKVTVQASGDGPSSTTGSSAVTTTTTTTTTTSEEGESSNTTTLSPENNSVQRDKSKTPGSGSLGPVIGGVVAGILVIVAIVVAFIVIRRRRASTGKRSQQKLSNGQQVRNQTNESAVSADNVYLDMKEGEYDHLNAKRKQISDNSTDTQVYDTSTPNEYGILQRPSEGNSKKNGQNNSESTDYAYSQIKGTSSQPSSGNEYDYSSHSRTVDNKNGFNTYDSCS